MDELLNQVANVGFPIVIAAYLLMRMEAKLDQLTASIATLANAVNQSMNRG